MICVQYCALELVWDILHFRHRFVPSQVHLYLNRCKLFHFSHACTHYYRCLPSVIVV